MHFFSSAFVLASTLLSTATALPQAAPAPTAPAFTLEGYAKTNPTAAVSGGAGGTTTTVTAAAALQSAVKVESFGLVLIRSWLIFSGKHSCSCCR